MKALTLTQPWASLVASGRKTIETRSWYTNYRGPLAIHAAKTMPSWAYTFATTEVALGRLPSRVPRGAILCIVELTAIVSTVSIRSQIEALERYYGDYSDGRWAWKLTLMEILAEPVPARGALGLWEWTPRAGVPEVLNA